MKSRALLTILLIGVMSAAPLSAAKGPEPKGPTAIVLCYHIVESPQDARMEVSRETFRQHMRYLAMTGYNVIPLRHLYEFVSGKRKSIPKNAIVITIDDGWRSTYTEAFPELQRRKFPFTVFIYPKIIGQTALALTWKQVREMADAGVDIQSHSYSHPYLTRRHYRARNAEDYSEWLQRELFESKRVLEKHTGREVSFLAYPYGDYDTHVAERAAKAGYRAALTCDFGPVVRGSDPLRMRRVVIDKRMDFASFRRYLGAGSMKLEEITPLPGQIFEPQQPLVVSAKIPNPKSIDPRSVGMALLGSGSTVPYSYDSRTGSISVVVRDALETLKGQYHRAIVWATDVKSGKRVEASWTFKLPDPTAPASAELPPQSRSSDVATAGGGGGGGGGGRVDAIQGRGGTHRAPRR